MQTEFQFKLSWKRGLSVLLLTLFSFSLAVAQVLVRGTVIDQTGESVPGASIQVKGGTQGTTSDLDGKFSLNVPNKKSVLLSLLSDTRRRSCRLMYRNLCLLY